MNNKKRWFISDRAIDDPSHDLFGHDDVAGQLVAIVESITPPATIGLLGGFGTGKSSIGNLLAKRLSGHADLQVVTLSAEKHSETARQRALVFSFAEGLREDAGVNDQKIANILGRVEESEGVEGPQLSTLPLVEFAKKNWPAVLRAAALGSGFALALYVAGVLGTLLLRAMGLTDENPLLLPINSAYLAIPVAVGLVGGLASVLGGWTKAALTPSRVSRSRPRAEAADELERVFAELVKLVKKRLVIVVDDIDRLPPNEVLEALSTIKTLQAVPRDHPPIFIISCDDGVVRRAIEDAKPGLSTVDGSERIAAEEYLNKLFVVRQYLPPHLKEDMQEFALTCLTSSDSNHAAPDAMGDALNGVLEILIHDGVEDPRHVIRLINAYFADYRLARVRESGGGRIGTGEVTGNPLMLARLTVLRVDFTPHYEAIRSEFELLTALDMKLVGGALDESQRRLLEPLELEHKTEDVSESTRGTLRLSPRLADFLRRTARYVERDVPLAPFFYMGQSAAGRVLGSQRAEEIRRALENNDIEALRLRLVDEASLAEAAVDHVKATLARARAGLPLSNAVATAAALLPDTPGARRTEVANEIATLVAREPESVPPPTDLAQVVRHADPIHHHALIDRLVEFEQDAEPSRIRAVAVLSLAVERPADKDLATGLDHYFRSLADTTGWSGAHTWLEHVGDIDPAVRAMVLGEAFFAAIVHAAVGAADDGIAVADLDFLGTLLDQATQATRESRLVAEAIRACGSALGKEPRWLAVHVLGHLAPIDADIDSLLLVLADILTSQEVGAYSETLISALSTLSDWGKRRGPVLASVEPETAMAAVAALSTSIQKGNDEVVRAGTRAIAVCATVWPNQIQPAIESMAVALEAHRDVDDAVGSAIQQALLSVIPVAGSDTSDTISRALFDPLETVDDEDDPAARMAMESVAPATKSDPGRAIIAALVPTWRASFRQSVSSTDSLRPRLKALHDAAENGAFPEDEEEAFMERLNTLPPYGGIRPEVAALALATIPWGRQRRVQATETIASVWDQLSSPSRSEVVASVSSWPPDAGELDSTFSELATAHALALGDDNKLSRWIHPLWPALRSVDRALVLAEVINRIPSIEEKIPSLGVEELLEALRRASSPNTLLLIKAAEACPEGVRSDAAKLFILGSFDDSQQGWHDESVRSAVDLLGRAAAADTVIATLAHLSSGADLAGRAASLLGWIRIVHPEAVVPQDGLIAGAIQELLPGASPDLADRLGQASKGIPWTRFSSTIKEMRRKRDEQAPREAAAAFESGRGGR